MGRGGERQSEKCSNWKIARQLKILRSEVVAIVVVVGPNVSQVRHEVRARKFFTAWQHPLTPLQPLPLPQLLALSVAASAAAVLPPSTCCGAARSECDNLADKMLTR